jgi:sporulation protein YlmC with PRC-barrel domain
MEKRMTRSVSIPNRAALAASVAACFCLGVVTPLFAADPPAANKAGEKCLSDLRAFDSQMEKDGYWRVGSGYGYGYPMYAFGYGDSYMTHGRSGMTGTGYRTARPGYEVRTLLAAANILARQGQQQACEDTLASGRDIYKTYVAEMQSGKLETANMPNWRQEEITAAKPVTAGNASFRSDQLLGTAVRNSRDDSIGSVDDIVMSPQTGKIAYLIVARGGIFGIDEKFVPVPWEDFKTTPAVNLLVLETDKSTMDAAPLVTRDQFSASGHFDQESQKVDAYWKAHLSVKGVN